MFSSNKNNSIPSELLDDIASRFLLDAPDRELKDPISLCFLTELAYWFYLDEYVEENDSLNTMKFDVFALHLLKHVNIIPVSGTLEEMLYNFRDFKLRVPTFGALLLTSDMSNVLLVQGFWHRASWGFPKGKINVDEDPMHCAIREVLEETGYDISRTVEPERYIETTIGEQKVRLYIVTGVPSDTKFVPRTKGEIRELKWFPIHQLPSHKNDKNFVKTIGATNMFYMVMPFVKPLRDWIVKQLNETNGRTASQTKGSKKRHNSWNPASDYGHKNIPGLLSISLLDAPTNQFNKSQSFMENNKTDYNSDQCSNQLSSSPRKADSKSRKRVEKWKNRSLSVSDDRIADEKTNQQPSTPKGSNKKRTKGPRGKGSSISDSGNGCDSSKPALLETPVRDSSSAESTEFRSYTWANFKIDKREINAALDKVWSNVSLLVKT